MMPKTGPLLAAMRAVCMMASKKFKFCRAARELDIGVRTLSIWRAEWGLATRERRDAYPGDIDSVRSFLEIPAQPTIVEGIEHIQAEVSLIHGIPPELALKVERATENYYSLDRATRR
ncbi:hypothetical protein SH668x_001209 [Planctomicrobium sp. SH668]|uniref:hypothetical protein n=1 Tax=Planctomicrobium sp. SH668 TaxID=3448126 RepID=UPI003F5B02D3